MEYSDWNPVYERIIDDFGFDRAGDEQARDELASLVSGAALFDPADLAVAGDTVAIAGGGPALESAIDRLRDADFVVGVSTAADRLAREGVAVDCVVTDLDKHPDAVVEYTHEETPVAIHAHGDNRPLVDAVVPECDLDWVIPTTQVEPVGPVVNYGGFTDGDRAAFLADHLGCARLLFPGWDFDDETVDPSKARKLAWAERLLYWLERRRGDRFSLLDGRRDRIDTAAVPID